MEWTVQCSRTVWFLVMFGRFEVRFLAKITCSDIFKIRFWWFWKKLGPFLINKVHEQFGFWWCLRGSKFSFGPKWDVWMCLMFDPLRFGMFEVRFFDVHSTSKTIVRYLCRKHDISSVFLPHYKEQMLTSCIADFNSLKLAFNYFSFASKPTTAMFSHTTSLHNVVYVQWTSDSQIDICVW